MNFNEHEPQLEEVINQPISESWEDYILNEIILDILEDMDYPND